MIISGMLVTALRMSTTAKFATRILGTVRRVLKGLCHEDFGSLGQFCAKIVTLCLYSYTKCSCNTMKISKRILLVPANHNIFFFLVIMKNIASELEKIGPIFSSFNPFPSLPSAATDDRKWFQCRKIVFNNKARPLFLEFS